MARALKIICKECGSKSIIKKTNRKHVEISDLYVQCDNVECGHSFVMNLTFSHTISPSAVTSDTLVKNLLSLLKPEQRQMALNLLQNPVP